jgi:hypothetical protein
VNTVEGFTGMNAKFNYKNALYLPFYPFLLGAYIPITKFVSNQNLFILSQITRSIIFFLVLTFFLIVCLSFISRCIYKAAFLASIALIVIWFYAFVQSWVIICFLSLFGIGFIFFKWTFTAKAILIINIFFTTLLLQSIFSIGYNEYGNSSYYLRTMLGNPLNTIQLNTSHVSESLPSIVHIVLDGYAGLTPMKDVIGYDNGQFIKDLEDVGFVVAANTRTPYNQTIFSMSSIFNGEYHKPGEGFLSISDNQKLRAVLGSFPTNSPVVNILSHLNYSLHFTDIGYGFLRYPSKNTVSPSKPNVVKLNFFEQYLADDTAFHIIIPALTEALGVRDIKRENINDYIRFAVNNNYKKFKPPFFIYEHIMAPHPPFTINRHGEDIISKFNTLQSGDHATHGDPKLQAEHKEGYKEKVAYINRAILRQVKGLINAIPSPKVIIIHGDHGSDSQLFHNDPFHSCLMERFTTFLAVYSDHGPVQTAFSNITHEQTNVINLYRILFNAFLNIKLDLLPNKSFFARWDSPQQPELVKEDQFLNNCY